MALLITATILNEQKAPIKDATIEACTFTANGGIKVIGTAKTNVKGTVVIRSTFTMPAFMVRICLQQRVNARSAKRLTEDPERYTKTRIDFGKVTVVTKPLVMMRANYFALPAAAAASPATVSSTERNELLRLRTVASKAEEEKRLAVEKATKTKETELKKIKTLHVTNLKSLQLQLVKKEEEKAKAVKAVENGFKAQIATLNGRISKTEAEKAAVAKGVQQWKTRYEQLQRGTSSHQAAIQAKEKQIAELNRRVTEMQETGSGDSTLEEVFMATGNQIENARKQLKSKKLGFSLGKVSMNLKMLPSRSGKGVSFIKHEDIAAAKSDVLSSVNIEFNPQDTASSDTTKIDVPDLVGYTRSLAIRKLTDAGLDHLIRDEIVEEPEPGSMGQGGRVLRQIPASGSDVEPDSAVTLIIGRYH